MILLCIARNYYCSLVQCFFFCNSKILDYNDDPSSKTKKKTNRSHKISTSSSKGRSTPIAGVIDMENDEIVGVPDNGPPKAETPGVGNAETPYEWKTQSLPIQETADPVETKIK